MKNQILDQLIKYKECINNRRLIPRYMLECLADFSKIENGYEEIYINDNIYICLVVDGKVYAAFEKNNIDSYGYICVWDTSSINKLFKEYNINKFVDFALGELEI